MNITASDFQSDPLSALNKIDTTAQNGIAVFYIDNVRCIYINDPQKIAYILDSGSTDFLKEFGYKKTRSFIHIDMFSRNNVWPNKSEFLSLDKIIEKTTEDYFHTESGTIPDLFTWCERFTMQLFIKTLLNGGLNYNVNSEKLQQLSDFAINILVKYILLFPNNINIEDSLLTSEKEILNELFSCFSTNDSNSAMTPARSLTTIFAGYEQMASIMFWCIVYFAELRNREDELSLASDENKRFFLNEVIRLHSPIWAIMRRPKETLSIFGESFNKEDVVITSPLIMGHKEKYFPSPYKFDPSRWNNAIDKFAFFPFSHGSRVCKGERYVRKVMHVILDALLSRNKVRISSMDIQEIVRVSVIPNSQILAVLE